MSKRGKVVNADKQKRETVEGDAQIKTTLPSAKARPWATVKNLPNEGKKMEVRRKVPSGPLGGSGRKTNVSRSS